MERMKTYAPWIVALLLFVPPASAHLRADLTAAPAYPGPKPLPPMPVRGVVYGDTRGESVGRFWSDFDASIHPMISAAIAAERPAFVIHTGDLTFAGGTAANWLAFDAGAEPLRRAGIPFYPVLGNHDYMGRNDRAMEHYSARFPHLKRRKWYTLQVHHTLFVILDSNERELDADEVAAQKTWLEETVRRADSDDSVRFTALACHHPPITQGPHSPSRLVRDTLIPIAKASSKFRVVLAGHVHSVERFELEGIHIITSGGGGAPLVEVEGDDLYAPGRKKRGHSYCLLTFTHAGLDIVIREYLDGAWHSSDPIQIR